MDILGLAKSILPANSPWLSKIEQAQQIASQFQNSKSGVQQLMAQYGKNKEDLRKALSALQSPMIAGTLNRISPNMVNNLQAMGQELLNDTNVASPSVPIPDKASELQKRLSALK